jgi:[ribosomal protein S5]-alanine N-acetyltransferase
MLVNCTHYPLFETIDTARLRLRCPHSEDAVVVANLMTPAISRWLAAWPAPITEQQAAAKILQAREEIALHQALHFLVERQTDNHIMGWIRVSRTEAHSTIGDLGYWLNEAYQHCGYATEAVLATVNAAFEHLNLNLIEAGAQVDNLASFTIMQRLGMEPCDKRTVWASARCRDELCLFYSVSRDQFMQQTHLRQPRGCK